MNGIRNVIKLMFITSLISRNAWRISSDRYVFLANDKRSSECISVYRQWGFWFFGIQRGSTHGFSGNWLSLYHCCGVDNTVFLAGGKIFIRNDKLDYFRGHIWHFCVADDEPWCCTAKPCTYESQSKGIGKISSRVYLFWLFALGCRFRMPQNGIGASINLLVIRC